MTTDTRPKGASVQLDFDGQVVTITGIAKGAGMICPNMATMLCFITTDAKISQAELARQTGVDYSILSGRIDRIKDTPYGQLTLALVGGDLEAAMSQLNAADVHVEVLR